MSPLLGIWASGQQAGQIIGTSFEPIATTTVGAGGAASVTFSSIPSTYTHLQVRLLAKSSDTGSGGSDNLVMSINSDTTYTNYRNHYLDGNGSAVAAGSIQASGFYSYVSDIANSYSGAASMFGGAIIDILDYTNTNKYKTIRSINGTDRNGAGSVNLLSSLWINTNAVTTLTFNCVTGTSISQYSSFALYGVKGS